MIVLDTKKCFSMKMCAFTPRNCVLTDYSSNYMLTGVGL